MASSPPPLTDWIHFPYYCRETAQSSKITKYFQPQLPVCAKPPGQEEAAQSPNHTMAGAELWGQAAAPVSPMPPRAALRHRAWLLPPASHPDPCWLLSNGSLNFL